MLSIVIWVTSPKVYNFNKKKILALYYLNMPGAIAPASPKPRRSVKEKLCKF